MTNEEKLYQYLNINFAATKRELSRYLKVSEKSIDNYLSRIHIAKFRFKNKILLKNGFYYIQKHEDIKSELDLTEFLLQKILLDNDKVKPEEVKNLFAISDSTWQRKFQSVKLILQNFNKNYQFQWNKANLAYTSNIPKHQRQILAGNLMRITIIATYTDQLKQISIALFKHFPKIERKRIEDVLVNVFIMFYTNTSSIKSKTIHPFLEELENLSKKFVSEYGAQQVVTYLTSITNNNFKKDVHQKITNFFKDIDEKYVLKISQNKNFINNITNHLTFALSQKGIKKYQNPIKESVKGQYPLEHNIAIELATFLEKQYDIKLNDDELSLLIIYIAMAMMNQNVANWKIYIHSHHSPAIVELLKTQIEKFFPNVSISESIDDCTIVISTTMVNIYKGQQIIIVNPILSSSDIKKMKMFFQNKQLFEQVKIVTFFANKAITWKPVLTEILTYINADPLKHLDKMVQRETISTTNINNGIAIPHLLVDDISLSGIYILKLKKAVQWNKGKKVSLIVLSLIYSKNHVLLKNTFRNLATTITKLVSEDIVKIRSTKDLQKLLGV